MLQPQPNALTFRLDAIGSSHYGNSGYQLQEIYMSTNDGMDIVLEQSRVEWLILADEAEVVNGKLYMMGGGWDRLTAQSLPWGQHMAIAVAIRVPWMDTNRQTSGGDRPAGRGRDFPGQGGRPVRGRPPGPIGAGTTPSHPDRHQDGREVPEARDLCRRLPSAR